MGVTRNPWKVSFFLGGGQEELEESKKSPQPNVIQIELYYLSLYLLLGLCHHGKSEGSAFRGNNLCNLAVNIHGLEGIFDFIVLWGVLKS